MRESQHLLQIASGCMEKALKSGADAADVVMSESNDVSIRWRLGNLESIERAETESLGLRVFVGKKGGFQQAIVSSNDLSEKAIAELTERAIAMAKLAPVDPFGGLVEENLLAKEIPELDLLDSFAPSDEKLEEWAAKAEQSALEVKGVTNSDGSDANYSLDRFALVTSNGFAREQDASSFSASVSVIAGKGTNMETDYDYHVTRHAEDLKLPEKIGRTAGERAVKRLKPRKIKTCQAPVIFDPRVAKSLLGSLSGAINGAAIARGTSFLKDKMNQQIFPENVNIIDNPLRLRGINSEAFDSEGVAGKTLSVVENGILKTWLLDLRSANKLGLKTNGRASRSISSPPHPSHSNFYMEGGNVSPAELMSDIKEGVYITDLFGMGINGVTGDYSQGAAGFFIEKGQITYPISEITIAGNLKDMFMKLIPANDLVFYYGTNCPTLRIEGMTIAGS